MKFTAVLVKLPAIYDYSGVLVFLNIILLLTFLWTLWKTGKRYANLPSCHSIILEGAYHYFSHIKSITIRDVFFQKLVAVSKRFEKEGMVHIWSLRNVLVIFGPEAVKVFATDEASGDKAVDYVLLKEGFGEGLVTSNGEAWKKDRKLLNPMFHIGMLKENIPILNENADILVKKLADFVDKPTAKLFPLLEYCAFQNLCESIFDVKEKASEIEVKEFYRDLNWLAKYMSSRWLFSPFVGKLHKLCTPYGWKSMKLEKKAKQFTMKVISPVIESVSLKLCDSEKHQDQDRKSFIQSLLKQKLTDPSISPTLMEDQIITFICAGTDTVIVTMMWTFYMLGQYKEVQKRAYDEVQSLADEFITYENLCQLEYLECIIKETLRLYPVVPMIARQLKKDIQCGKYTVPKDTTILFFIYGLHRNPEIYPDPERFDPDRFRSTNTEKRRWAHLPFSEGYRSCIGKKFAMMEMKIILAYVLRNYEIISFDRREDLELRFDLTLLPSKHLRMGIKRRQIMSEDPCKSKE